MALYRSLQHCFRANAPKLYRALLPLQSRLLSSKPPAEEECDAPIKYSTSPANKWKAKNSRSGHVGEERLWYEPYVIMVSLAVFLIYFTILREENQVDMELKRSLYSRISGLEEKQLEIVLDYKRSQGLDSRDVLQRLEEIKEEKTKEEF